MAVVGAVMVPHPPLIIPAVGMGREKAVGQTIQAYRKAAELVVSWQADTIVVLSPHAVMYADYFHISPGRNAWGNFGIFGAPGAEITVSYDEEFVSVLSECARDAGVPAGTLGERDPGLDHGTMVPLWFLQQCGKLPNIVRIGLSGLSFSDHYRLGQCIARAAEQTGRTIAIVASGDLSHKLKDDGPYGFQAEGPEYDALLMDAMGQGDFGRLFSFSETFCHKAAECGHRSFLIMAGALDGRAVQAEALSYDGPFGVGYGVCTFSVRGADPARHFLKQYEETVKARAKRRRETEDAYVGLARRAVEAYVGQGRKLPVPQGLPAEMYENKAGVFVSLKEEGRLRGCIGTIGPVQDCIAAEIIENAVSASTKDPRFPAVSADELDRIEYSVDVLGRPEAIASAAELDVEKYGVIVEKGGRRGLLLPNLEGIDTASDQVRIAKQKAGIAADDDDVRLARFEVARHG